MDGCYDHTRIKYNYYLKIRIMPDKNLDELDYVFSEIKKIERELLYLADKL
jgi:hypothetical protein